MNNDPDDIRRIARAARPSGVDDHDPEVAKALAELREDPDLLAELEEERQFDQRVAMEVQSQEPPEDLEDILLNTLRATRQEERQQDASTPSSNNRGLSRRSWMALAASAVVSAGAAFWFHGRSLLKLDELTRRLVTISKKGVILSVMSMDTSEVVGWLKKNDAPRATSLPSKLDALGRKGCHIYDIEGNRVSLECFLLPGMREIHLFTTPSSGLSGEPSAGASPLFEKRDGLTAAIWSDDVQTMILLTDSAPDDIKALFQA